MGTVDDRPTVFVSKADFDSLMDYSCSIPTGTTNGKWWKREAPRGSGNWLLGVYGPDENPKMVKIHWRRLRWMPWIEDGKPENAEGLPSLNPKASFH